MPGTANTYIYNTSGDFCKNDTEGKPIYYSTSYVFNNIPSGQEKVEYHIDVPYSHMIEECGRTIEIKVNFENVADQLLIQKFFSNYHIATGIIFFGVGLFLLVFAKRKKETKFILGIIFGEIFIFTFFVGMVGIHYKHMEWAFFITGLAIGGFLGYFMLFHVRRK